MADPDLELAIKVIGATRVANKFRHLVTMHPPLVDGAVKDWCQDMADMLAVEPYPPERPGQTYVRTYTLPTGWIVEKMRTGAYIVRNTVEYAHWVVSQKYQAWMHRDRWWTAEEKMAEHKKELTEIIMAKIKEVF